MEKHLLSKRLARYSALATTAMAGIGSSEAQIIYTPASPDQYIVPGQFPLDIDGDGTNDFSLELSRFTVKYYQTFPVYKQITYKRYGAYVKPLGAGNKIMNATSFGFYAGALAKPNHVSSNQDFKSNMSYKLLGRYIKRANGVYLSGRFKDDIDHYLGIKFTNAAGAHFGWVRLRLATKTNKIFITDYAYESTPGGAIHAGGFPTKFSGTGLWSSITNWDRGKPTSADDAVINPGAVVTIGATADCFNFVNNGSVSFSAGYYLNIGAGFNTANGTFNAGNSVVRFIGNFTKDATRHIISGGNPLTFFNITASNPYVAYQMNQDITANNVITLSSTTGFYIGDHTLYLKNPVAFPQNLKGDSTSSIDISGALSGINIPAGIPELKNLTLNNTAGSVLQGNLKIYGTLNLVNGVFSLGNNNLTIDNAASISGTFSSTAMVAAEGNGELRMEISTPRILNFPVGNLSGTKAYSPVKLEFLSGTFNANAYASVKLSPTKHPENYSPTNYLNRYWEISQSDISGFQCKVSATYVDADIVGTESKIKGAKWSGGPDWQLLVHVVSTQNLLPANVTSFSDFTGVTDIAQSNKNLNLTAFLEGYYTTTGSMNPALGFDANSFSFIPKWGPAIADTISVEMHDAANYNNIRYAIHNIELNTGGTATMPVPGTLTSQYYLTVKARNHIETVSAAPVAFSGVSILYDFSDNISKAYGNNLKNINGVYTIYAGDVSSAGNNYPAPPVNDKMIDLSDVMYVYNSALAGDWGYIPTDLNGDGCVDLTDSYMVYNNYILGIYVMTP